MVAWLYLTSVAVTNGSVTVSVTGNHDLSFVESGWSFDIGTARAEISSGTAPNDSGVSTLTLARPWAGANVTGQEAQIVPTSGALRAAIVAMNDTNDYAIVTHQTLEEIATLDKDVTIKDPTGIEHTFATMPKNARLMQEFLGAAGTAAGYDVTSSSTDTGNGANGKSKLLKVGDGGVNAQSIPIITDANSISASGKYSTSSSWAGSVFSGVNGDNQGYLKHQQWSNTAYAYQEFFNINNLWKKASRRKENNVWSDWVFDYNQRSIIGTVSQSAGKPTGSIIERGSNANGEYAKFADGTMICTRTEILTSGFPVTLDEKLSIDTVFQTPVTFANAPSVQLTATAYTTGSGGSSRKAMSAWIRDQATSFTAGPYSYFSRYGVLMRLEERQYNQPNTVFLFFTAIGRWY